MKRKIIKDAFTSSDDIPTPPKKENRNKNKSFVPVGAIAVKTFKTNYLIAQENGKFCQDRIMTAPP